jgi:hypothetical protein
MTALVGILEGRIVLTQLEVLEELRRLQQARGGSASAGVVACGGHRHVAGSRLPPTLDDRESRSRIRMA